MSNKIKLNSLTGIRFFAAACIVIGHAHNTFGSAGLATTFALNQGVSVFFILSGFILSYSYPNLTNKQEVGRFLLARFARLWPLHIAAIILLLVLVPSETGGYLPAQYKNIIVALNLLLIQAWIPLKNVILSLNGVSWSISTELFFYLVFPFLAWRWRENWPKKILLTLFFVLACIITGNYFQLTNDDSYSRVGLFGVVYTNPLVRVFEFTIGIATYFLYNKLLPLAEGLKPDEATFLEAASVLLAVASMWLTPVIAYSPSFIKVFGVAAGRWFAGSGSFLPFALLLLVIAFQRGRISGFLGNRLMVLLGEISFATYLIHTTILQFYNNHSTVFSHLSPAILYCLYWATVLVFSYLLYTGIEQPCRRWIVGLPQRLSAGQINAGPARKPLNDSSLSAVQVISWRMNKNLYCVLLLFFIVAALNFGIANIGGNIEKVTAVEADKLIFQSWWHDQSGAVFGNEFMLRAVDIKPAANDNYKLQFIWQAQQDAQLKYRVGIHFIDKGNMIVDQKDYLQSPGKESVKQGTIWQDEIIVTGASFRKAQGIAIAVYERPDGMNFLLPITASSTDWNGRRLVLNSLNLAN